ncbi:MAG: class I SAM-dependent methyltransferase [Steroidobacteraceae bacterium]
MKATPRGDYGIDAPYVLYGLAGAAVASAAASIIAFVALKSPQPVLAATAVIFVLASGSYLYTTRRGKFAVWSQLLESLAMRGDERLLDVGCGRGAVLMLAAKRLPRGQAVGIDLWSTKDQSGNSEQVTLQNAKLEGVQERVELHTADMRKLPFPDRSFDAVTSSLAIHNIGDARGREQALAEILRVLKPGGTALIADIGHTAAYKRYLTNQPGTMVERRGLGWQFWYSGPHVATALVTLRRTAAVN